MSGEEEESDSMGVSYEVLKKRLRDDWTGPDLVYTTVYSWITDYTAHSRKSTVGNFVNYCFTEFSKNHKEDYELQLWFMNLVVHHLTKDENWLETADDLKDWDSLFLNAEHWEVPPPVWAVSREKESEEYRSWLEEEQKRLEEKGEEESKESSEAAASPLEEMELKNKEEKTEESLESVPTSPLDPNWGKGLPAPSPVVAAPSTPMWRPWEEEEEKEIVNLSAAVQKRKRRSPAAKARSRQRLQQWQEKKDRSRLKSERRTTPCKPSVQWRSTRLADRLDSNHVKMDMARLLAESRTTPLKSVKQIRSANLLLKLDKYHFDVEELTNVETLEEESTVFFSNHSQTSMLPQLTSSSETLHKTSPSTNLKVISPVKNLDKVCPSCCARTMPITSE